jgi:hypothetical protein
MLACIHRPFKGGWLAAYVRVVLRAQARLAVVLAARGQRCYMESIDRCA